jgi:hypothetical protein
VALLIVGWIGWIAGAVVKQDGDLRIKEWCQQELQAWSDRTR